MRADKPQRPSTNRPKRKSSRKTTLFLLVLLFFSLALFMDEYDEELAGLVEVPIQTVRLESNLEQVREEDVKSALVTHLGAGFFGVDVQELKRELETHPWIDRAFVKRVWPDTLSISIVEEVAIARWGERDLLNQLGETFRPPTSADQSPSLRSLPVLHGPEGTQRETMEQYQSFSQALYPYGLRVRRLTQSERGSWELEINESVAITLGRTAIAERLERFITLYEKQIRNELVQIDSIDLRYANGLSIQRKSLDEALDEPLNEKQMENAVSAGVASL